MNVLVLRRLSRCALEFIGFRTRSPNALEPIGFKVLRFQDKKSAASSFAIANDDFISDFGVYKNTKKKRAHLAIDDDGTAATAAPARNRLKKQKLDL